MCTIALEVAMKLWSISDKFQKLGLMRKFLERYGELTTNFF